MNRMADLEIANRNKRQLQDQAEDARIMKEQQQAHLAKEYDHHINNAQFANVQQKKGDIVAEQKATDMVNHELGLLAEAERERKRLMAQALANGTEDIKRRREWAKMDKIKQQQSMKAVWNDEERKLAQNQKAFKTRLLDKLAWQEKVAKNYKGTTLQENKALVQERKDIEE